MIKNKIPSFQLAKLVFGFFAVTPLLHWPKLAWYLFAWLAWKILRIKLGQEQILVFRPFKVVVDVQGRGGLIFLHEILVRHIYDHSKMGQNTTIRTVFDAGANCGFFALYQATVHPEMRVFCFEPHPATFQRLQKNILVNHLEQRVFPIHAAVGASTGECSINISEESSMAFVSTSPLQLLEGPKNVKVPLMSLDAFAEKEGVWPDYLKVDVEGFEGEALRGAARCLEHARWVMLEFHSPALKEECRILLTKSGFEIEEIGHELLFGRKRHSL